MIHLTTIQDLWRLPNRKRQLFSRKYGLCVRVAGRSGRSVQMVHQVLHKKAVSAPIEAAWNEVLRELAAELAAKAA